MNAKEEKKRRKRKKNKWRKSARKETKKLGLGFHRTWAEATFQEVEGIVEELSKG